MKKKQGTGAVVFLPSGAAGSRSFFVSVIKGVKDAEDAEKQAEKPTVKGSDTSESGAPSVVDNTDEELFSQREMGKESYHLVTQEGGAPDANGSCYGHLAHLVIFGQSGSDAGSTTTIGDSYRKLAGPGKPGEKALMSDVDLKIAAYYFCALSAGLCVPLAIVGGVFYIMGVIAWLKMH
ncbi:unnamed protein product [Amoebophrya sp. A25]|nr:unnamed protein product [Amoebophrya sp. A25]|eukprot:GSA25T00023432001.1